MELSLFLAKLFGIYLLIIAVLWAVRGDEISKVVNELFANRPVVFLSGLFALAIGLANGNQPFSLGIQLARVDYTFRLRLHRERHDAHRLS